MSLLEAKISDLLHSLLKFKKIGFVFELHECWLYMTLYFVNAYLCFVNAYLCFVNAYKGRY